MPIEKIKDEVLLMPATKVEHDMPVNITEEDKIDFLGERSYRTFDANLSSFGTAWVTSDSVVFKNGRLLIDTLASVDHEAYYRGRYLVKKTLLGKKSTLDPGKNYLLVTDYWSAGHFHWFCDVLPKLICMRDKAADFVLLLPDTDYIRKIAVESITLLGIKFRDIVYMKSNGFYRVKDLFFVSKVAQCGWMNDEVMGEMHDLFCPTKKSSGKRVYISRARALYRKILNEEALIDLLKNHGFEIIMAEDMDLRGQISVFSAANTLLGIHGSGLTNCIFMDSSSRVIELRKKEMATTNTGYWHLASSLGQQYYYFNGKPDSNEPLVGKGCNLSIPLKDFEKRILAAL